MEQSVPQPQVALPDVPAAGDVIAEKYRVEGIIGVGGMGVILSARHLQLGQLVAIKVLTVSSDHRGDSIERFLREGRAAASLSSDHVVRIYDVGQLPSGTPFMVMERLRGYDLATVLSENGPLSVEDSVEYIAQAAVAIAEAHEVGIVHRDLKPSNLFLTQRSDGTACVKVLDFGISKQLAELETPTLRNALTSTRQVMGSPAYMSPEQVRDAKTVDHRTDIWALGVTLYELLTHHVAFGADTLPAVCAAIVADPPVPVRNRRADVPEAVEHIVQKCLEKSPANRYQSARALLGALRTFQGKSSEQRSRSEGKVPLTATSAELGATVVQAGKPQADLVESGPRSIETESIDPTYGTLVSARTPLRSQSSVPALDVGAALAAPVTNQEPSAEPIPANPTLVTLKSAKVSRRGIVGIAAIVLTLVGVTTTGLVVSRSESVGKSKAAPSGDNPFAAPALGSQFTLRVNSVPNGALILEAGNPIGVTPFLLKIDRNAIQQSAREFVLRKDGYSEATIRQGDSATDVQQNVVLAQTAPRSDTLVDSVGPKPPVVGAAPSRIVKKPGGNRTPSTTSPLPSTTAPGIRIAR